MSHEIDETTGQAACFVTGEPAWHRLGKVISTAATSDEALKLAVLDWLVEKRPLFLADGTEVHGRVANVRSDTGAVLGVVGNGYRVVQNAEAFRFMDALVGDKLAMFETAGALKGGKVVWMLARIPKELRAAGEDVVHPYVLLTNGHDGARALRVLPTTVRVVCANTLNLALGRATKGGGFVLHHHKNLDTRVAEAQAKLGLILQRLDTFEQEMQALAKVSVTETQVTDYLEGLFPTGRKALANHPRLGTKAVEGGAALLDSILDGTAGKQEVMAELLAGHEEQMTRKQQQNAKILEQILANYKDPTNTLPGIKGTAWALYNAVSEWADHQRPARGKDQAARDENRLSSIWFGPANDVKQEAYAAALQLANAV
jgi:phage/plasmid-like protein (TIGR03299 family)